MERLTRYDDYYKEYCRKDIRVKNAELYEKLGKYEDLEEQGKLLKLPCAVGDNVYVVMPYAGYVKEEVIIGVSIKSSAIFMMCDDEAGYSENVFGKTVFLTREEAEAALKEL